MILKDISKINLEINSTIMIIISHKHLRLLTRIGPKKIPFRITFNQVSIIQGYIKFKKKFATYIASVSNKCVRKLMSESLKNDYKIGAASSAETIPLINGNEQFVKRVATLGQMQKCRVPHGSGSPSWLGVPRILDVPMERCPARIESTRGQR